MNCIWLGQAGLLFDFDGFRVMVDPYLSNSVASVNPANYRRVPADDTFLDIKPDVLILTHNHLDHTDPETLQPLLNRHSGICVLASQNAWKHVRTFGGDHNYVMFDRSTQWTQGNLCFRAVHAQHSDSSAIGAVISYKGKEYYIAGDTLYHRQVIDDLKQYSCHPEVAFLPVNGVGNNMNMSDAAQFAKAIHAQWVVPVHFGLFDQLDPCKDFHYSKKIVPRIYQRIDIPQY